MKKLKSNWYENDHDVWVEPGDIVRLETGQEVLVLFVAKSDIEIRITHTGSYNWQWVVATLDSHPHLFE